MQSDVYLKEDLHKKPKNPIKSNFVKVSNPMRKRKKKHKNQICIPKYQKT